MAGRMSTNQTILTLKEDRDKLSARISEAERLLSHLKGELSGIDRAIAVVKGLGLQPSIEPAREERLSRGALKDAVLSLLSDHKEGLKAIDLIDLARARGQNLDRGSVASLLSRLAKDNVILFDRDSRRYGVKNAISLDLVTSNKAA